MSRKVSLIVHGNLVEREMPDACSEVLPGVIWGDPWTLFTPAYWLAQAWMSEIDTRPSGRYSVKHGLIGELGFCLLGGFGITDRKSTLLNSSHLGISYAVFCLKKKKKQHHTHTRAD